MKTILSPILGAEIVLYSLKGSKGHLAIVTICMVLLSIEPLIRNYLYSRKEQDKWIYHYRTPRN